MTNGPSALSALPPQRLAEIALAGVLVLAVAGGTWRLTTDSQPATPLPQARRAADPGVFARFDAFHRAGSVPPGLVAETGLVGWRLMGTRTGADASAILQRPDGVQVVLFRGEAQAGVPELRVVAPDHVVLVDGGREVRVEFSADPPPPPAPPTGGTPVLSADAARAAAAMGVSAPPQNAYVNALRPQMRDGAVEGFVWRRGAAGGALARLGLREGDVILSVGGEALTNAERVAELDSRLVSGDPVEIRYRRGGQVLTATVAPTAER